MATYNVCLKLTVSTVVTVDAADPEAAVEAAWDHPDMPGSMTVGAFGQVSVDEDGDWEPVLVTDEHGDEVWTPR